MPPDPITSVEKSRTLQRLNQVIQHRLVTSKLPPEMGSMVIGKCQMYNVRLRAVHQLVSLVVPNNFSPPHFVNIQL